MGAPSPPGDELTELAGVAESQTESVQAWALDNGSDAPAAQRLTPGRITAAAVVASVVVTGVATVIALQHLRGDESALTAPTPTATVVAPPPSPTRPAPPLLDGTYRIFHDWAKTTFRNNERSVGGTAHWESEGEPSEVWFAYSATCTETECIAAGTELQHDHRTAVPDSLPMVLRLENGIVAGLDAAAVA